MMNKTYKYDPVKKESSEVQAKVKTDAVLQMLFVNICYKYKKECMEDFFMDPRLCLVFKYLAPIISKEGHNICQNRQTNKAKGEGKEVDAPQIFSE